MKQRTRKGGPLVLRLYIAGESPNSVIAQSNLRAAVSGLPKDEFEVEIVDALKEPERALGDGVLVTPTLIRFSPAPELRAVGNLKDRDALQMVLGKTKAPDGH